MKIRCLTIYVYRSCLGDCTNHGVSSKYNRLLVACPDGPDEVDSDDLPENFMMLENRYIYGDKVCPTLYPAEVAEDGTLKHRGEKWYMMGGNYGATSDSRFSALIEDKNFYGAVAIHDRVE